MLMWPPPRPVKKIVVTPIAVHAQQACALATWSVGLSLSLPSVVVEVRIAGSRFAEFNLPVLSASGSAAMRDYDEDDEKGFLWRLPKFRTKDWGKLGPAFGFGIGCGVGLGAGIVGGAGIGLGFPGLQFGFGVGAGCGVGVGCGYGLGKGKAYDENGTHSNVGRLPKRSGVSIGGSSGAEIGAILDDLASGVKRVLDNIQSDNGKRKR